MQIKQMSQQEISNKAERARQLLGDKMLVDALDLIEQEIIDQWEACPVRDPEGRETLWKYYKISKKFRGILQGAVESGKVAAFREQSLKHSVFNMFKSAS